MMNLKKLGKALTKAEQKIINGGLVRCSSAGTCWSIMKCCSGLCVDPGSWADPRYCGI